MEALDLPTMEETHDSGRDIPESHSLAAHAPIHSPPQMETLLPRMHIPEHLRRTETSVPAGMGKAAIGAAGVASMAGNVVGGALTTGATAILPRLAAYGE